MRGRKQLAKNPVHFSSIWFLNLDWIYCCSIFSSTELWAGKCTQLFDNLDIIVITVEFRKCFLLNFTLLIEQFSKVFTLIGRRGMGRKMFFKRFCSIINIPTLISKNQDPVSRHILLNDFLGFSWNLLTQIQTKNLRSNI